MALFTLMCAFHHTSRLLERTLPLAIRTLTRPTRHEFEVVLVADRSSDSTVAGLIPRLHEMGVDELRFRRTDQGAFNGAPSNNFHGHHFTTTKPYLISFTDDTFMVKTDEEFDVLDAAERIFTRNPEVALISKVDDHDEWDHPLVDLGAEIDPGVRSVNRVVDQLIIYNTERFATPATRLGAWHRDTFVGHPGFEYQWENLASHVGTTGGRKIAYPDRWPLRVRHSDLRNQPGSMHGTQDEDIKIKCFDRLWVTSGATKN